MSGFDGKDTVRETGGCLVCVPKLCCGNPRWVPHTPNSSLALPIDIQEQRNVSGAVRHSIEAARLPRYSVSPKPSDCAASYALGPTAIPDVYPYPTLRNVGN
jgi:hypothetical protein